MSFLDLGLDAGEDAEKCPLSNREGSADTPEEAEGHAAERAKGSPGAHDHWRSTDEHANPQDHPREQPPQRRPRTAPPRVQLVAVRMHNLPRGWMHEDIIHFIHAVGEHAGIPAPLVEETSGGTDAAGGGAEGEADGPVPRATSPYVQRLTVPFGRRTGLVYGSPRLLLTSRDLAKYLATDLTFDPDDHRNRIHFTIYDTSAAEASSHRSGGSGDGEASPSSPTNAGKTISSFEEVEESVAQEQADALRTLELDRYLMAPDLLLDIAKMHQRRLVTANEKVLLDSFLDEDDSDSDGSDMSRTQEGSAPRGTIIMNAKRAGKPSVSRVRRQRRAGDLQDAGRGSMHNTPIPKPYVQGRSL